MPWPAVPASRRDLLVVAIGCAALLAPFLARPLNIDDPCYVWAARHIAAHPLDPYGFTGNWLGTTQPFVQFMQNPPGVCYYMAAAGLLLGWSDVALHAALLPVGVLAAVGTYLLAARFCRSPLAATSLMVVTPAFLVSATTLMCDVPMACLWVWSVLLWVRGSAADRTPHAISLFAGSSVLAAAAVLTKYPGIDLVPLLAAHAFLCPARRGSARITQAVVLLFPIAGLLAWDHFTSHRYGIGMVRDAAAYARTAKASDMLPPIPRALNTLCFVGGGGLSIAAVAVTASLFPGNGRSATVRVAFLLAAIAALGLAAMAVCRTPTGWTAHAYIYYAQYGLLAVAGVAVLVACCRGLGHVDRRPQLFLLTWIAGVFVFAAVLNWTVNVRSVLPLMPAACILAVRAVEGRRPRPIRVAAGVAAGLAIAIAIAEYRVAVANRDVARRTAGPAVWFTGHWGFQYYMQLGGARPVDAAHPQLPKGDIVVLPLDNDGLARVPAGATVIDRIDVGPGYWLTTMNNPMGGGFYASYGDRLPFVFGPIPPESFLIARVVR